MTPALVPLVARHREVPERGHCEVLGVALRGIGGVGVAILKFKKSSSRGRSAPARLLLFECLLCLYCLGHAQVAVLIGFYATYCEGLGVLLRGIDSSSLYRQHAAI